MVSWGANFWNGSQPLSWHSKPWRTKNIRWRIYGKRNISIDPTCDTFEWPATPKWSTQIAWPHLRHLWMASYTEVKLTDCICISAVGECGPLLGQYTLNCSPKKWEHYKIGWSCNLYITHSTTSALKSPGKTKVDWKTNSFN